jgi:hypothetical protein
MENSTWTLETEVTKKYTRKLIKPVDMIQRAKALPNTFIIHKCTDFEKLEITSETYLEWARQDYKEGGERKLNSCISNAKLAICSKLDNLLTLNHLGKLLSKNYPNKIEVLEQIGVSIPPVVFDLIIDPRNDLEHRYKAPSEKTAKDALGVAALALQGISDESCGIVALNWTKYGLETARFAEPTTFPGWSDEIVLFVDVFDCTRQQIMLIDEIKGEIQLANLDTFNKNEAIEFAQLLRSIDKDGKGMPSPFGGTFRHQLRFPAERYKKLKSLGNF